MVVAEQGELAHRRLLAHETVGLEHLLIGVGDVLAVAVALQPEAFLCHAPHQPGGFLEAGRNRLEAGAIGRQARFLPGEVSQGNARNAGNERGGWGPLSRFW